MIRRGALIVLEGCDKCGKTTQAKMLVKSLENQGVPVEFFRFPDRETIIGKVCSDYLQMTTELEDHAIHLLFTANRWELVPKMLKLLESGTNLIVDRYSYSGVAFSAFKKNVDLSWCKKMETGLPQPDAVFYLDVSEEEASKRRDYGRERYENKGNQLKVAEIYQTFSCEKYWKNIDANQSIEDVQKDLLESIGKVIKIVGDKKIKKLWTNSNAEQ